MARAHIKEEVSSDVLIRSARRCAFCVGLDGSFDRVEGQIAHVDRDNANAAPENLAFLCLRHHDEYDSKTSQSKGFTQGELIKYRSQLYEAVERGDHHRAPAMGRPPQRPDPEALEHDRALFTKADKELPEVRLVSILECLAEDHTYNRHDLRSIRRFSSRLDLESNRFLSADVQSSAVALSEALDLVNNFAAQHFEEHPWGQDRTSDLVKRFGATCCLLPALRRDPEEPGSDDPRYNSLAKELATLTEAAKERYVEYRRAVKRVLFV